MKKQEAIQLVKDTFGGGYNGGEFERFTSNLLKGEYTQLDKRRDGHYVREAFRGFVRGYRILGNYEDTQGKKLDILEVTLHRDNSLERARTAQRNFVADYLKQNNRDAALVAFLSPEQTDWRFSFVKLEYSLEVNNDGKLKTQEELTPAKRWSFLVGEHEGSHTVQSRFVSILKHEEKPVLEEFEKAFNIESVTDEFFKKYCDLFFRMKESLDVLLECDPAIKSDFEAKELTTVDFAKKTLGQMAFLYFLQKKGWFGVAPGKAWGTGPKDFLRQLFNRREKYGQNFFDDVLEPLFYEALAQDRGVESIYPRLNNCRMPFLNGGLFEPMNGYSWETTNIRLPDTLFSNKNITKEGDIGDGILDIFDRYNFTVNENEPLEKEVAIDPEMLGKVFENLLEIKDRKSKGAFYTPREIVHFMCQESLINYLNTETGGTIPQEDLTTLMLRGSQIVENDSVVLEKGREGTYKYMLPESIRARAGELDKALANIKVCDPAVGSGAFPLGMLNEIIQARQALGVHLRSTLSSHNLKLHSISHSIYGVDIDPGAVEIAKLRLWLSLVVEEDEPHPLPNLDHKIMQGNSLIAEYGEIKLFDESFLDQTDAVERERVEIDEKLSRLQREYFALHSEGKLTEIKKCELENEIKALSKRKKSLNTPNDLVGQEAIIFDTPSKHRESQEKTRRLQKKIELFISESRRSQKEILKAEIDTLKWELIEASLRDQEELEKLSEIESLRHRNIRPFFVWKLEFSDVFKEKRGFDVIIENPPYLKERDNKETFGPVNESILGKRYHQGKMDFWYYFLHIAIDFANDKGTVSFITPRYWINSQGAKKLIERVREQLFFVAVMDIGKLKVFDDVAGHHMVAVYAKEQRSHFNYISINNDLSAIGSRTPGKTLSISSKECSEVFSGDGEILFNRRVLDLSNTVDLGSIAEVSQGVVQNPDKVSAKAAEQYSLPRGNGVFVLNDEELKELNLSDEEMAFVKPFYDEKSVSGYQFNRDAAKRLLYITKENCSDISPFFNIERHLHLYRDIMNARRETISDSIKWFQLHWPRKERLFEEFRIIMPSMFNRPSATYLEEPAFFGMSSLIVNQKNRTYSLKYILAILNSTFAMDWFSKNGKARGAGVDIGVTKLKSFPIKQLTQDQQQKFIDLVDEVLRVNVDDKISSAQKKIKAETIKDLLDTKVFDIYGVADQDRDSFVSSV